MSCSGINETSIDNGYRRMNYRIVTRGNERGKRNVHANSWKAEELRERELSRGMRDTMWREGREGRRERQWYDYKTALSFSVLQRAFDTRVSFTHLFAC